MLLVNYKPRCAHTYDQQACARREHSLERVVRSHVPSPAKKKVKKTRAKYKRALETWWRCSSFGTRALASSAPSDAQSAFILGARLLVFLRTFRTFFCCPLSPRFWVSRIPSPKWRAHLLPPHLRRYRSRVHTTSHAVRILSTLISFLSCEGRSFREPSTSNEGFFFSLGSCHTCFVVLAIR